ncbi:MAG: hypothetical protein WC607_00200 [Candidatus Micrarchaeia archaeon]
MEFKAVRVTDAGNLVLEPVKHKNEVRGKLALFVRGRKVAVVFDTIASVESPLYLAKPLEDGLLGKKLESKGA